jgi:hypothetical protein
MRLTGPFFETFSISVAVNDLLREHDQSFIPRTEIARRARCPDPSHLWHPELSLALDRQENAHRLFPHPPQRIVQIENRRVIAPAAREAEWPGLKADALSAFGVGETVPYPQLQSRLPSIEEPDFRTVLNVLVWDGELTVDAPGGPADWASMTFSRPAARSAAPAAS